METLEVLKYWISEHPTATMVLKYLVWVLFIIFLLQFVKKALKKRLPHADTRYKSQKVVETIGYFLLILLTISYLPETLKI